MSGVCLRRVERGRRQRTRRYAIFPYGHVQLSLPQPPQSTHAGGRHAPDHDARHALCRHIAGRALQQRRLRGHRRGRGPGTFEAPAGGAGGRFSTSNSVTATVGADASGAVGAPTFTANGTAGNYTVTASSPYGLVTFSLTNTATGIPARLAAILVKRRSTKVGDRFRSRCRSEHWTRQATLWPGSPSHLHSVRAHPVAAVAAPQQAQASSVAALRRPLSPPPAASRPPQPLQRAPPQARSHATASVSSGGGAGATEGGVKGGDPGVAPVSFSLANLAGKAAKISPASAPPVHTRRGACSRSTSR